jgi:hypothetical protein
MAEVFSLPVSTSLLSEVNAVGDPKRIKAQDGTIGDRAHMTRTSDHNLDEIGSTGSSRDADDIPEVHARDVDSRGPWLIKGGAERIVQLIVAGVRARGHARRRVKYVIYRRRIWKWVDGQFVERAYDGTDPHTEHFHVSFEYGSGSGSSNPENDTSPWGILAAYQQEQQEDFMAGLTERQQQDIDARVWHTWLMTRNIESMMTALMSGASSRPKWADKTTGYTYPAVAAFPNVTLGKLAAEGVTDADLKAALKALPSADDNARAFLEAVQSGLPEQIAASLRIALGEQADAVFRAGLAESAPK